MTRTAIRRNQLQKKLVQASREIEVLNILLLNYLDVYGLTPWEIEKTMFLLDNMRVQLKILKQYIYTTREK